MGSDDPTALVHMLVHAGRCRFTHHALQRCAQRGIDEADVFHALGTRPAKRDVRDAAQFITWTDTGAGRIRIITRHVEPMLLIITVIHD